MKPAIARLPIELDASRQTEVRIVLQRRVEQMEGHLVADVPVVLPVPEEGSPEEAEAEESTLQAPASEDEESTPQTVETDNGP